MGQKSVNIQNRVTFISIDHFLRASRDQRRLTVSNAITISIYDSDSAIAGQTDISKLRRTDKNILYLHTANILPKILIRDYFFKMQDGNPFLLEPKNTPH
jgi:hypothetical protein